VRPLLKSLALGSAISAVIGVACLSTARFSMIPLRIYFAPAAFAEKFSDTWLMAPLVRVVRDIAPEGGALAGMLFVLPVSFFAWSAILALLAYYRASSRRRTHVVSTS
jgi:hypothetical protein